MTKSIASSPIVAASWRFRRSIEPKGLEAQRVFVLEANALPLRWTSQRPDQLQQELNLLYVALTRAKRDLFLLLAPDTTAWNEIWAAAFQAAGVSGSSPNQQALDAVC